MTGTGNERKGLRPDDFAGIVTIIGCFVLIVLGKEIPTATAVLTLATGFLFGKHTNKRNKD